MIRSGSGRCDRHIDFLGRLHLLWAFFNAVIGAGVACFAAASGVLAVTARRAEAGTQLAAGVTAAGFLVLAAAALFWAAVNGWCGRGLLRRERHARTWGLVLALLNALLFPLGTALAGYSAWVLMLPDTRTAFGEHVGD
jgi:hypothetical protein